MTRTRTIVPVVVALAARTRADQRGQAMVELGICLMLFLALGFGIVEFGRVLMLSNVITHAARHGARSGSVVPPSGRTNGTFTGSTVTNLQTEVRNQMANVMSQGQANAFGVAVSQPTINGMPLVQVRITGSIPYLFSPLLYGANNAQPSGLAIDRTVTFRDEGR